jgi:hypothetical protein
MKKCLFSWCLLIALAATGAHSAKAAIVPLSDLLAAGQTFQSGDKVFSNFTYTASGDMPTAANVNVENVTNPAGDFGIRISGGFVDQPMGSASDALVTFNVAVAPGVNKQISGAILTSNTAVFAGPGLASVTETFLPTITDQKLVVYDFGGGDEKLLDSMTFAQTYATLPVQKDIILHATGDTGAVTMSFVDQYFPQVPEPSSMVLALCGLIGFGSLRRRTR